MLRESRELYKQVSGLTTIVYPDKHQCVYNECEQIINLANTYLERKNYSKAAKLINNALCLLDSKKIQDTILKQRLEQKKTVTEELFIDCEIGMSKACSNKPKAKNYINFLHKSRKIIHSKLAKIDIGKELSEERSNQIEYLSKFISEELKKLIQLMISDCIDIMGTPPCAYAVIILGSPARDEATSYSDIEYAILVEQDSIRCMEFFTSLSKLLEIKIINLGETPIKDEDGFWGIQNYVRKGISLDIHKNPAADNSLIGVPWKLSSFQHRKNFIHLPKNHLSISLRSFCLIAGSKNADYLVDLYQKEIASVYDKDDSIHDKAKKWRHEQSLKILSLDIKNFNPNLFDEGNEGKLFLAKTDLYRFPSTLIDSLALYYGIECSSNWSRIDELHRKKLISQFLYVHLKQLLSIAQLLRLKIYRFYHCQREDLNIIPQLNDLYYNDRNPVYGLLPEELKHLESFCKISLFIFNKIEEFCNLKGLTNCLRDYRNEDDNSFMNAMIYARLYNYKMAKLYLKIALKNSPKNFFVLRKLAHLYYELGNFEKAIKYFKNILSNEIFLHSLNKNFLKDIYIKLAAASIANEDKENAFQYLNEANKIRTGSSHNIIKLYNHIGALLLKERDYQDAIKYFKKALSIIDTVHQSIANSTNETAKKLMFFSYDADMLLHKHSVGLQTTSSIDRPSLCEKQHNLQEILADRIDILSGLAKTYLFLEKPLIASCFSKEAFHTAENLHYGKYHPINVNIFINIGMVCSYMNQQRSSEFINKAFAICERIYGAEHIKARLTRKSIIEMIHKDVPGAFGKTNINVDSEIISSEDVFIKANNIVSHSGKIIANNVHIEANNINISGEIIASGNVFIKSSNMLNHFGKIIANNVHIEAYNINVNDETIASENYSDKIIEDHVHIEANEININKNISSRSVFIQTADEINCSGTIAILKYTFGEASTIIENILSQTSANALSKCGYFKLLKLSNCKDQAEYSKPHRIIEKSKAHLLIKSCIFKSSYYGAETIANHSGHYLKLP